MRSERKLMCTRCKGKPAIVKKPFTSELLCRECFLSDLVKRVKRNLSRSKQLNYGEKVAYLLPSRFLISGALGLKIVSSIEKKYSSEVHVFLDSRKSAEVIEREVKIDGGSMYILNIPQKLKKLIDNDSLLAWWRRYRAIASHALSKRGFRSILFPICAEASLKMEISSILAAELDGVGESKLFFQRPDGFSFVNIFHGISCREAYFLSYLTFPSLFSIEGTVGKVWIESLNDKYAERLLLSAIKFRSGEILHSVDKSMEWLLGSSITARCRFCGGLSIGKDTCNACTYFENPEIASLLSDIDLEEY
ncbi:MAG: hypothetical protein QXK31_04250 [Fervidicoccaceae archaeon]